MVFFQRGRCFSVTPRFQQPSRSYHVSVWFRHRALHRPSDHRQSQAAGRVAAASAVGTGALPFASTTTTSSRTTDMQSRRTDTTTINSGEQQQPVAGPSCPQAYMYRMRTGRFDSLTALLSMPYAVAPLRILTDLLCEVMQLKVDLVTEGEGGSDAALERSDALETLERMTKSLSDPLAVSHLLAKAIETVREAVEAASAVGDHLSEREVQRELREVEHFIEQLRQWNAAALRSTTITCVTTRDARCQRLLSWRFPNTVMAEIWHALLELCSLTGAFAVAVESLNQLIDLSELVERAGERGCDSELPDKDNQEREAEKEIQQQTFTLDGVVESVEEEARDTFRPVAALDHIRAIESCVLTRKFDIAHSLYQRYMQHAESGAFPLVPGDIAAALVGLAHACDNVAHFAMLQELFVESEAAQIVPVSVELYTAIIDAVSRASEHPQRMAIALALYRRLRDGGLAPDVGTYAALIACCASTREPTHAFAFYQEARQQCGVDQFTPAVYTNLLLSYARAGYGADARQTLEVLVEAGAPLTRGAFHAVLSCAVTLREAEEVLQLMQAKYGIAPTPQTYAYLVRAAAARPAGVSTALHLFDWHELALRSLLEASNTATHAVPDTIPFNAHSSRRTALGVGDTAAVLEEDILTRYPAYGEAVEGALLRLRVDPTLDPRLEQYMRPLLRIAQLRMNAFTGMAPQTPTRVPKRAAIAVLAADVLANIEEWFLPFVSHYSAVVIPYSSLVALRSGGGRRVDTTFEKGPHHLLNDSEWRETGSEHHIMVESRRRLLTKFLQKYRDVIHLVSIADELALSRDCDRYGIGVKKTFSRSAALALNLARMDIANGTKVYAEQNCDIVLVSTNFEKCGKYVVNLKRELLCQDGSNISSRCGSSSGFKGLADGLRRVWYHNPRTSPQWRPPQVSVVSLVDGCVDHEACQSTRCNPQAGNAAI
ncbi:hypothetical protein DQ04_00161030 [Trypanosoma grayi]|uniref:hypothetical protein n=1 Tax=Trypanosoma grayi TaxID=71804 RepID=UPI0004F47914|nr:hypothetical protein DQ04_00161030 [Trypanosoma grayi]KEG15163.1 hypothetical protein DQ04_00161030 [Trypanosoma grayi]